MQDAPHGAGMGTGYEIGKVLGRGCAGTVYQVTRLEDGKVMAMKCINCDGLDDVVAMQAFREVSTMQQCMIEHETLEEPQTIPWIVLVDECWLEDVGGPNRQSQVIIVMEMVDGFTLAQYLQKLSNPRGRKRAGDSDDEGDEPRVPTKTVYRWLSQILVSLAIMHRNRVIHRDLKTDNILVTKDLQVAKVCDFSVARVIDQKGGLLTGYVGTPNYAAPEVITGRVYDTPCDMWSLGCCLYEMLALKQCFKGPPLEIVKNIQKGIIPALPDDVDSSLDMMCHRLLNPNPAKRPTAIELCRHPAMRVHIANLIKSVPHMCNVISEVLGVPLPPELQPIVNERLAKLAERREEERKRLAESEEYDEYEDEEGFGVEMQESRRLSSDKSDHVSGEAKMKRQSLTRHSIQSFSSDREHSGSNLAEQVAAVAQKLHLSESEGTPSEAEETPKRKAAVAADFVSNLDGGVEELMNHGFEIDEDVDFDELLIEQDEELQVSIVALLQGAWEATGDMAFSVKELDVECEEDGNVHLRIQRAHRRGNPERSEFLLNDVWVMVKGETSFLPPQYVTWQRVDQQDLPSPDIMCWMRPIAAPTKPPPSSQPRRRSVSSQKTVAGGKANAVSAAPPSGDSVNVAEVTLHVHSILGHVLVQCGLALELEKIEGVSLSVRRVDEGVLHANLWRAQPLIRRTNINNHLIRKPGPLVSGLFEFYGSSMSLKEAYVTLFQAPFARVSRPGQKGIEEDRDEEAENLNPFKLLRLLVEPVAETDILTCTPIAAVFQAAQGSSTSGASNRARRRAKSIFRSALNEKKEQQNKFLTTLAAVTKLSPSRFASVGSVTDQVEPSFLAARKTISRPEISDLTYSRISPHLEVCLLSPILVDDLVEKNCGLLLDVSEGTIGQIEVGALLGCRYVWPTYTLYNIHIPTASKLQALVCLILADQMLFLSNA
ncbi:hypothetical protein FOL47_007870 [Perkinsus chesapeaki]|uniref:non-specific serine/threonine protein kinase n=1 Tax=Perkinsus chesapeaki TaxID=330153 RepID=A0A7J6LHG4_PERCH|nr:hypothetical protein FOL47_007870 [Perkinsus chesapeaki]